VPTSLTILSKTENKLCLPETLTALITLSQQEGESLKGGPGSTNQYD
jgi:hypothetical protein